jgi:hypothetical protein
MRKFLLLILTVSLLAVGGCGDAAKTHDCRR